jgi:hypothetical protein
MLATCFLNASPSLCEELVWPNVRTARKSASRALCALPRDLKNYAKVLSLPACASTMYFAASVQPWHTFSCTSKYVIPRMGRQVQYFAPAHPWHTLLGAREESCRMHFAENVPRTFPVACVRGRSLADRCGQDEETHVLKKCTKRV